MTAMTRCGARRHPPATSAASPKIAPAARWRRRLVPPSPIRVSRLSLYSVRFRTSTAKLAAGRQRGAPPSRPISYLRLGGGKELQRNGGGHRAIARRRRMQVVAGIIARKHAVRMRRIADGAVEIGDRVEVAAGANPGIDRLPVGFGSRAGVIVTRPAIGRNGRTHDLHAVSVGAKNDLFVGGQDAPHHAFMLGGGNGMIAGEHAEIVDAYEHEQE